MFQPKLFYRELERVLHDIDAGTGDDRWFAWIVSHIASRFGEALSISNGRLYTDFADEFVLDHSYHSPDPDVVGLRLSTSYPPVDLILTHGVYIFDETVQGQSPDLEARLGGPQSAAILIEGAPRRILAFGLRSGWDRDHLDFALRTIRNAINHQLSIVNLKFDLQQAAEIQKSLLPDRPPDFPGFSIAARSVAATSVGGDFYDLISYDRDSIEVAVGDASGHGVGAALLARDVLTGLRMASERDLKLTAIMSQLTRVVARSSLSTRFVSLFLAELEASGNLAYVNAGHPPPWIIGARGVQRLSVGGPILGPIEDVRFRRSFARVDPGDMLVVVTDGLLDRTNRQGAPLGEDGIEEMLAALRGQAADAVLERVFELAWDLGDGSPWEDDTSAVVIVRDAS